ncbi:xanthine dehydrogenase family protein subunit M [Mucilaginibacter corticis]|uniref:Xanthine dehydrogenase family protein subunit M n=1 Tax=Mucilaginibacter corticis TaxID=2597670 RepID=A0A556M944_9SPHI|nr:xanthine dehydrogenase family protein subunit M [Mucilaginibacter corticis]TSJ36381.1 xanthine dehydrogenase family protein subunit M [Mucilaginibacter corticis]
MQPFKYIKVPDTPAAIRAAGINQAKFIAGGTNVLDLMKLDIEKPRQLVDINQLSLYKIEELQNGGIRVGALVKNSDLAYNPAIKKNYPLLSEAILSGASPQLRNMATTGGNLMQRTRCPYFYSTDFACNKRVPGSGCAAISGYNRMNAVLGTSDHCIATHPSDMCVAMAALGAVIHVQGAKGTRAIPFADFHLLPGQTPHLEHNLKADELITHVELPPLAYAARSHYLKVRDRASYEFALTSAAVALDIQNGIIKAARVALGGVGTKPWRSIAAEQVLTGLPPNTASYQKAADTAMLDAKPNKDNAYKIELAKRTLVRALTTTGEIS